MSDEQAQDFMRNRKDRFNTAFGNVLLDLTGNEDKKGVINIGGKSQTIYKFAKKHGSKTKKKISKGEFPKRMDMNLNKLKKILKK